MQKKNYYYNLISKFLDDETYDLLLYQTNSILFNYGNHHKSIKNNFRQRLIVFLKEKAIYFSRFLFLVSKSQNSIIISNSYVELPIKKYKKFSPPWSYNFKNKIVSSYKLSIIIYKIQLVLSKQSIKLLFSDSFIKLLGLYEEEFTKILIKNNVKAIIVPNDLSFFENFSIKIGKKNKIPTFVYLHGIPGRYNPIDDNRADYLIVWGKGIKEAYNLKGVPENKIFTIKHPVYNNFNEIKLRSNLSDVLVLTKAIAGTPSSSDKLFLGDRSKSLFYLEKLKLMLLELGVKKARLRLHPSESKDFYLKNLIDDFYFFDNLEKVTSLNAASLVIGPTSTMILDSIKTGVNYILFDPKYDNKLLDNSDELVTPFDGSSFINLSVTVEDFKKNISNPKDNINQEKLIDYFMTEEADFQKILNIISV